MVSVLRLPSPFARLQVLSDLTALSRSADPVTWARAMERIPSMPDAGVMSAAAETGRLVGRAREGALALSLAATLPRDCAEGFVASTALLIADRLQGGDGEDDLYWHIDAHMPSYLALPAGHRGAILRGISALVADGHLSLSAPLEPEALITRPASDILSRLSRLARAACPETRAAISRADRRQEASRHRAALDTLLARTIPCLPRDRRDRWHPGEVVDLTSLHPAARGFGEATALLLIEAIALGDGESATVAAAARAEGLAFRWMQFDRCYTALPGGEGQTLLDGFRYLWETCSNWDPYRGMSPDDVARNGLAIPSPAA